MGQEEITAVTAHWLLGRLAVLRATDGLLERAETLDTETRLQLAAHSRTVMGDMQSALHDLVRGLPPLSLMGRERHGVS